MDLGQQKEVVGMGRGAKQRAGARGVLKWDAVVFSLSKPLVVEVFEERLCASRALSARAEFSSV